MQCATAKKQQEMGDSIQLGADVQVEARSKFEQVFGPGAFKVQAGSYGSAGGAAGPDENGLESLPVRAAGPTRPSVSNA